MNPKINKQSGWAFLLMLLGLILVACTPTADVPAGATGRGITVIGQGEAMGQPTQANASVGVEISAATVTLTFLFRGRNNTPTPACVSRTKQISNFQHF